jgi:hypothetical protein
MPEPASLARKLNLKPGMKAGVLGKPDDVNLADVELAADGSAEAIIAFARTKQEVDETCDPVVEAAKQDRIAWIAYPKAGKLGTDLNRDILWKHLKERGVDAVRQVSLDEVWSALRFRPPK